MMRLQRLAPQNLMMMKVNKKNVSIVRERIILLISVGLSLTLVGRGNAICVGLRIICLLIVPKKGMSIRLMESSRRGTGKRGSRRGTRTHTATTSGPVTASGVVGSTILLSSAQGVTCIGKLKE